MKSYIKLLLFFIFSIAMVDAAAQIKSTNNEKGWPVSKGVQRYSNKSLGDHKPIQVNSVGAPAYTQSKDVHRKKYTNKDKGNVELTGTPDWVVSKQVNLINK